METGITTGLIGHLAHIQTANYINHIYNKILYCDWLSVHLSLT